MKFLQDRSCLKQMNGQRRSLFATCGSFQVIATFFLMLLIMIMCGTQLSEQDTWHFLSPAPTKIIPESKLLRCFADLSSTLAGLFFFMHRPKCILVSLISFGIMFALTVYLVLLSLRYRRYHKKRGVRRCKVSSCLWTRRKIFWLQRGQSRTAYVLAALESSIKARKCCRNEASERIKEMSTTNCSNILKIITLAFTAVMTGSVLYMVNDSQKHEVNIQSLSNLTLEYRNSGHPLIYRDKVNV